MKRCLFDMSYEEDTMIDNCGEGCFFTYTERSNGLGGYHAVNLMFHNPSAGIHREITNEHGEFIDFPGYLEEDWMKYAKFSPDMHIIRFSYRTENFKDGRLKFCWIFQPDGSYYADEDSFGMEDDWEIVLVSVMDTEGKFIQPFRMLRK